MAGRLIAALFPGQTIFGFAEAGDPRTVPRNAVLEEDWTRPTFGGAGFQPSVRWIAQAKLDDVDAWMAGETGELGDEDREPCPLAEGFVVMKGGMTEAVQQGIHLLVGFCDPEDRPARRYAPTALVDLLAHARAVVLLHLDKHAPTLSIYTDGPLDADDVLHLTARAAGAFPVPFAIPPMLARWDRALYELRMSWDPARDGEFPVPPADDAGGRWSSRRRRLEEAEVGPTDAAGEDRDDGDEGEDEGDEGEE